jgi:hypothetical protein
VLDKATKIMYAGVGIIERVDEISEPQSIKYAVLLSEDELGVEYTDGAQESFPVKQGSIEPYTFGIVLFSTRDGGEYIIREVTDLDGSWISKYKIKLPPVTLKDLLTKPEVDFQMPYLETEQESLIALVEPEDKGVVGVMYTNTFGAFVRINEMWVSISPSDTSFDGLTTYDVKAETAEEFISTFDDSDVSFTDVEDYLTAVE